LGAARLGRLLQAWLRALVEQAIGHLASAWALRRWRGLLSRVRGVFRATGALVCLGRWLRRVLHEGRPIASGVTISSAGWWMGQGGERDGWGILL
jgi:hypothetical protein